MMQTVTLRRVETLKVEVAVIQPLSKITLEAIANQASLGGPALGKVLAHEVSDYTVVKADPQCECQTPAKARKAGRRG